MAERTPLSTAPDALVEGHRMDQPTFHALYEAMPPGTRAELKGDTRRLRPLIDLGCATPEQAQFTARLAAGMQVEGLTPPGCGLPPHSGLEPGPA